MACSGVRLSLSIAGPPSVVAHARSAFGQELITQPLEKVQPTEVESWKKDFRRRLDWNSVKQNSRLLGKITSWGWDLALAMAIVAMAAGVWFAFLCWKLSSPMFGMFAVLLVFAGPALGVAIIVIRPDPPGGADDAPEGLLVDRIHRADAALKIVGLGRAHVGVIGSYVVILWICETAGMVSLKGLLVFLTFVCAMTALAYLPWLGTRERRLYEERAEFQRQLGELEARRG